MLEKYDLSRMLEEIAEDEKLERGSKRHVSQDDIRKMLGRKQKVKDEVQ